MIIHVIIKQTKQPSPGSDLKKRAAQSPQVTTDASRVVQYEFWRAIAFWDPKVFWWC